MADRCPPGRAASRVSLVIDADLQVEGPWGRPMTIAVHDGRGTLVVPRAALRYSSLRALLRDRVRWSAGMQSLLGACGLTIVVTCKGRTIAMISGGSNGNWLARLLRLGPVEIRWRGVLAALVLPATETGGG